MDSYQEQVLAAQRQYEFSKNRSQHALFRKANAALFIRLYKLRSVVERLHVPLIVSRGVGSAHQLQEILWHIAVETRRALAECPRDIRGNLRFSGSSAGIPDGKDSLDLYAVKYYDCEPPVYNAQSARASIEHSGKSAFFGVLCRYNILDGKDSLDLYAVKYYDCEPLVYNAQSARASIEHGVRTIVHPGGPGYPWGLKKPESSQK